MICSGEKSGAARLEKERVSAEMHKQRPISLQSLFRVPSPEPIDIPGAGPVAHHS
jgi:hypothetical protein